MTIAKNPNPHELDILAKNARLNRIETQIKLSKMRLNNPIPKSSNMDFLPQKIKLSKNELDAQMKRDKRIETQLKNSKVINKANTELAEGVITPLLDTRSTKEILDDKMEMKKQAMQNSLKLFTDRNEANDFIVKLGTENPELIKFFNQYFPNIYDELSKKYKLLTSKYVFQYLMDNYFSDNENLEDKIKNIATGKTINELMSIVKKIKPLTIEGTQEKKDIIDKLTHFLQIDTTKNDTSTTEFDLLKKLKLPSDYDMNQAIDYLISNKSDDGLGKVNNLLINFTLSNLEDINNEQRGTYNDKFRVLRQDSDFLNDFLNNDNVALHPNYYDIDKIKDFLDDNNIRYSSSDTGPIRIFNNLKHNILNTLNIDRDTMSEKNYIILVFNELDRSFKKKVKNIYDYFNLVINFYDYYLENQQTDDLEEEPEEPEEPQAQAQIQNNDNTQPPIAQEAPSLLQQKVFDINILKDGYEPFKRLKLKFGVENIQEDENGDITYDIILNPENFEYNMNKLSSNSFTIFWDYVKNALGKRSQADAKFAVRRFIENSSNYNKQKTEEIKNMLNDGLMSAIQEKINETGAIVDGINPAEVDLPDDEFDNEILPENIPLPYDEEFDGEILPENIPLPEEFDGEMTQGAGFNGGMLLNYFSHKKRKPVKKIKGSGLKTKLKSNSKSLTDYFKNL